jgi:hypothetical protein
MPKKDALAREPGAPKRERRKRQNQSFRNCPALVWFRSVDLVRATLAVSPEYLSKSFIAAAYYWQVDTTQLSKIENARRKYEKQSQTWRDSRLRAYSELLRDKRISFERVVESAGKPKI